MDALSDNTSSPLSPAVPASGTAARAAGGCAGTSPVGVIRGESSALHALHVAHPDWLAFTVKAGEGRTLGWLRDALVSVFNVPADAWKPLKKGWTGYTHCVELGDGCRIGYGGAGQKGTMHVQLSGMPCSRVEDWSAARAWGESVEAVITRADLAHDDFEGRVVNIDAAVAWYQDGAFKTGGRQPSHNIEGDWFAPGSPKGRTFYVGRRQNGKLCRVYEKGKQLGDPCSPWCRVEVEWHHQDRHIPWEILTDADCYLAGAYPCLRILSAKHSRIRTQTQQAQVTYEAMREWARTACGKFVNVMMHVHRGDADGVVSELAREGAPPRLAPVQRYIPAPSVLRPAK